jgi:hypothetical protein
VPLDSPFSACGGPARFGPSRTLHQPDDHRRTSDGRWSRSERQLDAVNLTECAAYRSPERPLSSAITRVGRRQRGR